MPCGKASRFSEGGRVNRSVRSIDPAMRLPKPAAVEALLTVSTAPLPISRHALRGSVQVIGGLSEFSGTPASRRCEYASRVASVSSGLGRTILPNPPPAPVLIGMGTGAGADTLTGAGGTACPWGKVV